MELATIIALSLFAGYLALLVLTSAVAISGFRMFRPIERQLGAVEHRVSIIVPAKDEADTLYNSLSSLCELEYPNKEVIVVCGPSSDGTTEVANEFGTMVAVVPEPKRPVDWLGKSWACHQGYLRSTGDILLFTDGDVTHARESLRAALAYLDSNRIDLLSVWPETVTRAPSERLMLPVSGFFLSLGIAAFASKHTPRGKRLGGANGQYLMITRRAYEAIGGHESVKNELIEDGAIGRRALQRGFEVVNANGDGHVKVSPYGSFREVWEAHQKFGAGLLRSQRSLIGVCTMAFIYFVAPFGLLAVGLGWMNETVALAAIPLCAVVYATTLFFSRRFSRFQYSLLAPISGCLVAAAFVLGFLRFRRGGVTWKGVEYGHDRMKSL